MLKINLKKIAEDLIPSFYEAGKESIKLSGKNLKITIKKDNTPVTNGDLLVDKILQETISDLTPNIQIVSEENVNEIKKFDNNNFWLIDPIDGTREYIKNKNEYTLNAALILNKKPVLGVIYAPKLKRLFYSFGKNNVTKFVKCSSSLKFCLIAAGEFDIYAARARAKEWDIAAGHAIAEHAGAILTTFSGKKIIYGKKDFANPALLLKRSNNLMK